MEGADQNIDSIKCTIAISSRVLLDLKEATKKFEKYGLEAYLEHMQEEEIFRPGAGWTFIKQLNRMGSGGQNPEKFFKTVLVTKHHIQAGIRLLKSMKEHHVEVDRASFCDPDMIIRMVKCYNADLFLIKKQQDIQNPEMFDHLGLNRSEIKMIRPDYNEATILNELRPNIYFYFADDGSDRLDGTFTAKVWLTAA